MMTSDNEALELKVAKGVDPGRAPVINSTLVFRGSRICDNSRGNPPVAGIDGFFIFVSTRQWWKPYGTDELERCQSI